jgi:hypothetical protein
VEVLAALVAMGYRPPGPWLRLALAQVQHRGFATFEAGPGEEEGLQGLQGLEGGPRGALAAGAAAAGVSSWAGGAEAAAELLHGNVSSGDEDWEEGEGGDEGEAGAAGSSSEEEEEGEEGGEGLQERLASNSQAGTSTGAASPPASSALQQQQRQQLRRQAEPSAGGGAAREQQQQQQRWQDAKDEGEEEEEEEEQGEQDLLGAVLVWDPASPVAAAALQQGLRRPLDLDQLCLLAWCLDQLDYAAPEAWVGVGPALGRALLPLVPRPRASRAAGAELAWVCCRRRWTAWRGRRTAGCRRCSRTTSATCCRPSRVGAKQPPAAPATCCRRPPPAARPPAGIGAHRRPPPLLLHPHPHKP